MGFQPIFDFFKVFDKKPVDPYERLGSHGREDLTSYLTYRHYDEYDKIYSLDEGIGFTIAVVPMVGISQQRFDRLNGLLGALVPDDVTIQITHISHNKIGNRVKAWGNKWKRPDPIFQMLRQKKTEYWCNHANTPVGRSRTNLLKEHLVYFSVSRGEANPEEYQDFLEYQVNCLSTLNTIFGFARHVHPDELITMMRSLFNPTSNSVEPVTKYDSEVPINEQIIKRDTSFLTSKRKVVTEVYAGPDVLKSHKSDRYDLEENEIRCFEVGKFPPYVNFGFVASLIGDEFDMDNGHMAPVIQCVNIYYPPAEESKNNFEAKSARAKQVAEGITGKWNTETREKSKDFERAQQAIVEGGRVVNLSMYGAVIGNKDVASAAQKSARSLYQSLQFDVFYPDKVHLPMFLMTMPMMGNFGLGKFLAGFGKRHTNVSNMVTSVIPIYGEHFGTKRGGMLLVGRNGQVMEWGPFVSQGEGNNNTVVLGASGSGKSVGTSEVITNHVARGGAACVIDNGYSFDNLCKVLGGNHYEFTTKSEFCLNIFDLIDVSKCQDHKDFLTGDEISGDDYLNERLELARAVFAQMIFADKVLTGEESGVLTAVCKEAWDKFGGNAGATEVAQLLRHYETTSTTLNSESMFNAMRPYIKGGTYEKMFNGKNTLDVSNDLNVFELKPLENQKRLRDIIMAALFGVIDMKCTSNRAREDLIVIDEAWIYLYNLSLCEVMQGWARRLRKENAGLYIATQTADEMLTNDYTKAIMTNSQWRLIFKTPDSSVDAMAEANLVSNDYCRRLLKDIDMIPGEYSEVMIMSDGVYYVGRLMLDPYSMSLYTTSPDDVIEIKRLTRTGLSIEQALSTFVLKEEERVKMDGDAREIAELLKTNALLGNKVLDYLGIQNGRGL